MYKLKKYRYVFFIDNKYIDIFIEKRLIFKNIKKYKKIYKLELEEYNRLKKTMFKGYISSGTIRNILNKLKKRKLYERVL